jgi:hypothetical protein
MDRMKNGLVNPFCLFLVILAPSCLVADEAVIAVRSRREFAEAMSRVTEGMPAAEVVRLLGKPDDIRTEHDAGGISTSRTKEIWRYGTSGHLTTATLGQVYIDEDGRAQYIYGRGDPPPDAMFAEPELRRLLDTLGEVPSYNDGLRYNPRAVIQAVNLLQPLGKGKALAAIQEHLRTTDEGEGAFLVLRTLFEVPEDPGYMPRMHVGAPSPTEPKNPKLLPRFPITIEGDIPLLLVTGYSLAGHPEHPMSHVNYFREHGKLREKQLVPIDAPFAALDELANSPRWIFNDGGWSDRSGRHILSNQLLRLMDSVYRIETGIRGELLPPDGPLANTVVPEASRLKIRWSETANEYVFIDGTSLPKIKRKIYRRESWQSKSPDVGVKVFIERQNQRIVSIWLDQSHGPLAKRLPASTVFKVFRVKQKRHVLLDLGLTDGGIRAGQEIELDEGDEIQIEVNIAKRTEVSPSFAP